MPSERPSVSQPSAVTYIKLAFGEFDDHLAFGQMIMCVFRVVLQ